MWSLLLKPAYAAEDLSKEYAFGHIDTLGQALGYLRNFGFTIATIAVTFYFIIGAIKYITAEGDKTAIASARAMITHSIIGFLLLMVMFVLLQYVTQAFSINVDLISQ